MFVVENECLDIIQTFEYLLQQQIANRECTTPGMSRTFKLNRLREFLAFYYAKAGQEHKSEEALRQILTDDPDHTQAYYMLMQSCQNERTMSNPPALGDAGTLEAVQLADEFLNRCPCIASPDRAQILYRKTFVMFGMEPKPSLEDVSLVYHEAVESEQRRFKYLGPVSNAVKALLPTVLPIVESYQRKQQRKAGEKTSAERLFDKKCLNCGATAQQMHHCSGCSMATYCTQKCQKAHWPKHKNTCKQLQELKEKEKKEARQKKFQEAQAAKRRAQVGQDTSLQVSLFTKFYNFQRQRPVLLFGSIVLFVMTIIFALHLVSSS